MEHQSGAGHEAGRPPGFTLLEVMVVVVIFGIVLAAAVPNLGRRNEWNRLQGTARDLSSRLQTARALAVSRRTPYRMTFNVDGPSYAIERQETDSTWVREPDVEYMAEGVEAMQVEINGETGPTAVVLEPRGTVRSDDAPALVRFFGSRGDTAEVSLVRTGRVSIRLARSQS